MSAAVQPSAADSFPSPAGSPRSTSGIGASLRSTLHVVESLALQFRRALLWNLTAGFLQPLLYLLGLGVGVGTLVDRNGSQSSLGGLSYVSFVAPGLLATSAMASASVESMWPVLGRFKWEKSYHAQIATPITSDHLVFGHLVWLTVRMLMTTAAISLVFVLFPDTRSTGLLIAVPAASLCGLAMAMPLTAVSITRERDTFFAAYQRFALVPLFLFGGAFYPISQLPGWLQAIMRITPTWHGVSLCRAATSHALAMSDLGHVAYLVSWAAAGTVACLVTFRKKLDV
jgi:lipooligosaccharide transport system permease protein